MDFDGRVQRICITGEKSINYQYKRNLVIN